MCICFGNLFWATTLLYILQFPCNLNVEIGSLFLFFFYKQIIQFIIIVFIFFWTTWLPECHLTVQEFDKHISTPSLQQNSWNLTGKFGRRGFSLEPTGLVFPSVFYEMDGENQFKMCSRYLPKPLLPLLIKQSSSKGPRSPPAPTSRVLRCPPTQAPLTLSTCPPVSRDWPGCKWRMRFGRE